MEQILGFLVRILSANVDLTLPQLHSNSVGPGRCLSAPSFTEKANLVWNLEGRKPWLEVEVFVTGQGHRNGRILLNRLPSCQRSSSLPLGNFSCVEFATDCLQAVKGGAGETNKCTEKWPEFTCCGRSGTHHHHWQSLLTTLGWRSQSWFNWSSVGPCQSHCTLLEVTFPTVASVEQAVVSP